MAHTWVEQLRIIASNGTFVGAPGYPRGFVQRTSPAFSDFAVQNQVPPNGRPTGNAILSTDLMCRQTQTIGNQTEGSPALAAAPLDNIALIYEENGHVTLLDRSPTKPVGSGTIFIYGTKNPSNTDTYLGIHRVWNTAGTGGDKRGKLLTTRQFDDGQCFQDNNQYMANMRQAKFNVTQNALSCQSSVQLPEDAGTSGSYSLYWVWEWPTLDLKTGNVVTNESYTTCMDINMISSKFPDSGKFDTKQDPNSAAIQAQLSTNLIVNPTIPPQLTSPVSGPAKTTSTPAAATPTLSQAAGSFVTVTVSFSPAKETVYVTNTMTVTNGASLPSQTPTKSTITVSPLPLSETVSSKTTAAALSSKASSTEVVSAEAATNPPAVVPFLNPVSSVVQAPSSAPASTVPSTSSTALPIAASTGYPNGTLNDNKYRLRGRLVRV